MSARFQTLKHSIKSLILVFHRNGMSKSLARISGILSKLNSLFKISILMYSYLEWPLFIEPYFEWGRWNLYYKNYKGLGYDTWKDFSTVLDNFLRGLSFR